MGTHIARFEYQGHIGWAVVRGTSVHPIVEEDIPISELIRRRTAHHVETSSPAISVTEVRFLAPISRPCSIVCQGVNYATHREEAGLSSEKPPFNLMFMKADSSLSGPHDDVIRPAGVELLDYEIELGLIIGKAIEQPLTITNENLHEYVAGIVITNDVSARDIQVPQNQWFKGKSFRTFCPVGPYVYLIDNGDSLKILNLNIQLEVNGEVRQSANTSQLIYKPAETLTELSGIMSLYPGDLIQTGTPGGVAISAPSARMQRIGRIFMDEKKLYRAFLARQRKNTRYLKDGDTIRCTIKGKNSDIDLGIMETRVRGQN